MKIFHGIVLSLALGISRLMAQTAVPASATTPTQLPAPTAYSVVTADGNSQVWQRTEYELGPDGKAVPHIRQYTELATGLNHLVNGQWIASSENITILPDGTAAATNGQHQVYFPANIYNGQIKMVTPEGRIFRSQPLGLSYDDGSNTVLIAALTNATGELISPNQVLYPNAFVGVAADLRYTYTKAGFEQDIILHAQPPTPESFNLDPANTRLQMLTEFFQWPPGTAGSRQLPAQAGLALSDDTLDFGIMKMAQGKAFLLGTNALATGVLVGKEWANISGRQILIEQVPVMALAPDLSQLPAVQNVTRLASPLNLVSRRRLLPEHPGGQPSVREFIAKAGRVDNGLVLDYNTINGSLTNYTFQGDTTYYISGAVNLYGTNTFEGGTVIKYANTNSASLDVYGPINCLTGPYRPAVFTAKDDNSVGQTISGSTGNPTGYYGYMGLYFVSGSGFYLHNIRMSYLALGIGFLYGETVRDAQFVKCQYALGGYGLDCGVQNVLVQGGEGVFISSGCTYRCENVTFDQSTNLVQPGQLADVYFTNSLVVVGNTNGATISGMNNQFLSNDTGIFQSAGAGSFYLATNSTYRNAGTTNIDPNLLADLATKTTYPPIVYSNVTLTTAMTFSPQAQRDNTGSPDLGYHYDPLDYIISNLTLSATLTLTNGVAVGLLGSSSIYGCAINPQTGANIVSFGLPQMLDRIVSCQNVQEQPSSAPESGFILLNSGTDATRKFQFRFTDFSLGQGELESLVVSGSGMGPFQMISFGDCWLRESSLTGNLQPASGPETIGLTNNLILRGSVGFAYNGGYSYASVFNGYNNLFRGGTFFASLSLGSQIIPGWNIKDNLFDGCTQSVYTDSGGAGQMYISNNGYTTGTTIGLGGSGNKSGFPADYQTGTLGTYYYPTNGGNLSQLLGAGSRSAAAAGLYHYTITTNQVVEGNNTVSIGFHYVATDQYGNPLDTNGDGIPDYLEDANGNGLVDSGEIGWNIVGDLGLQVIISQPRNGSTIP